ncbi:MAG TPA: hypothetical protein VL404_04635 [Candidatus Eisenbacteria bacterium]|jgi:membrane associated rhomboid family serine protease|nr:hypothetical protein [Candidatus Eisenbacteria bacterium]
MGKSGGKNSTNLLRLSGMIFTVMGAFHVLRYFEIVRSFDFTYFGSLLVGIFLLVIALLCMMEAK